MDHWDSQALQGLQATRVLPETLDHQDSSDQTVFLDLLDQLDLQDLRVPMDSLVKLGHQDLREDLALKDSLVLWEAWVLQVQVALQEVPVFQDPQVLQVIIDINTSSPFIDSVKKAFSEMLLAMGVFRGVSGVKPPQMNLSLLQF